MNDSESESILVSAFILQPMLPILMIFFFSEKMANEIQTHQSYENKSLLSNFPSSNPTP